MKILKQKNGTYKVESHVKGKYYIVDPQKGTCTCPHYRFRMARIGGLCKHLQAVKDKAQKRDVKTYNKIIDFVKKNKEIDSLTLIKKFSEEAIDDLLSTGELIEEEGKIRVLE